MSTLLRLSPRRSVLCLLGAGAVLLAVDWTGMAEADRGAVTTMVVTEPDRFAIIPERLMQGQVHAQSVHRVGELAERNPNETATIVRQWLSEPAE